MKKEDVILTCYSLLRKETPLKEDCGRICNGKCCKGDENTGMIIFPGEEKFLDENIKIKETKEGVKIAVCNGTCDRNKRPLSCRIYPLFPLVVSEDGEERIRVIYDPRATASCPLCAHKAKLDRRFVRAVRRAGKYLLLDEQTAAHLRKTSEYLTELIELEVKLGL